MLRDDHPAGELTWEGLKVKTVEDNEMYYLYLDWRETFQYAYGISLCQSPCRDCAETVDIIGHHTDYSLPGRLVWLCKPCHLHRHWHIVHGGEELIHADGCTESLLARDGELGWNTVTDSRGTVTWNRRLKTEDETREQLIHVK